MDLNLTVEEAKFRDELRAWLTANVPKGWEDTREEDLSVRFEFLRKWQRSLFDAGWAGISWPKQYGGRGASLMQQVIFWQEKRFLEKILSAEEIWCQGFSEPNAGSDLAGLQTEARLDGDYYVVNGQKVWTSYGWAADWCELVVRTDPSVPKHKGLTVLLLDMKSPGVDIRPLRQMTGETEFNEIFFRDVRVPVSNVVGKVNDGWSVAIGTLMHERGTFGAGLQILYKRNMDRLIELARTTKRNGRPAAEDPIFRQKLAQCYAEIEIMRLNQMRAFSRINATGVPGPEGSIQKIFWSELNQRFQQIAQELLGPFGQLDGKDEKAVDHGIWSYGYLRSRGNTIEAGTSEIQRNIIGHFVLGLPRSY